MSNDELPEGWQSCSLGDVVDYGKSQKAEPSEISAKSWILELEDIEKDTSRLLSRVTFAERKSKSTKNRFETGDVLYGKLRPYLNKILIADQPGYCTTEIIPLRGNVTLENRYLFYWLKHPAFLDYVTAVSHGLNMPRLGTEAGKAAPFILAPLAEQKRIADKLEAVLGRVDACRARLDRVPALLKRFRQSVLAAATSGGLTEEIDDPDQWESHQFGNMFLTARTGLDRRSAAQGDDRAHPYLKMNNMTSDGRMLLNGVTRVDASEEEAEKYSLEDGDFLFNTRNSVELVGKTCVFKSKGLEEPFLFNNNILRVRFKPDALPDYVNMWFCSPKGRDELEKLKSATTSVAAIYQSRLNELQLSLPPRHIQQEIVRRVEDLFAFADRIEAHLGVAQKTVDRLSPSVLAKAFRGELVPQDPADEPASSLLVRLRSQPLAKPAKAKRTKRK